MYGAPKFFIEFYSLNMNTFCHNHKVTPPAICAVHGTLHLIVIVMFVF